MTDSALRPGKLPDGGKPSSQPEFEFVPGPHPGSLRIVYRGFWDEHICSRYLNALHQRSIEAGGNSPVNHVLLDVQQGTIQSQPVIDKLARTLKDYSGQVKQYAMLMSGGASLLALQMRRLTDGYDVEMLNNEAEAQAWLATVSD